MSVDMDRFYREEDLFPREFTGMTERPWGLLFHNRDNPDSFDSNHALLRRGPSAGLRAALEEIRSFYRHFGAHPVIYQSMLDEGWFAQIAPELEAAGFRCWEEEQRYMVLTSPSRICPDPDIDVQRETAWQDAFADQVFLAAGEPWEIPVIRRMLQNPGAILFAARIREHVAGLIYGHVSAEGVCRVDYLLTAPAFRYRGVGRALVHAFAAHCRTADLPCFLWPDGETPRRIYEEAGWREAESRMAGRASLK